MIHYICTQVPSMSQLFHQLGMFYYWLGLWDASPAGRIICHATQISR